MLAVLSQLVILAKAVPQIKSTVDKFFELYIQAVNSRIESEYQQRAAERLALINSIKRAANDEERKAIMRSLMRNYN